MRNRAIPSNFGSRQEGVFVGSLAYITGLGWAGVKYSGSRYLADQDGAHCNDIEWESESSERPE
jgi:hypothetical protein